jgi:hypothetical protein
MNDKEFMELTGVPDKLLSLVDKLNKDYPGHSFMVSPLVTSDDLKPLRGVAVRLPTGEVRKLRTLFMPEEFQDAEAEALTLETAVMLEFEKRIREEMNRI